MKNSLSLKRNEMTKKLQVRGVDQTPYPSLLHGASLATAMQRLCRTLLLMMNQNFDVGVILIKALWYRGCPHTRRPYIAKSMEHLNQEKRKKRHTEIYIQENRDWICSHG